MDQCICMYIKYTTYGWRDRPSSIVYNFEALVSKYIAEQCVQGQILLENVHTGN